MRLTGGPFRAQGSEGHHTFSMLACFFMEEDGRGNNGAYRGKIGDRRVEWGWTGNEEEGKLERMVVGRCKCWIKRGRKILRGG